MAGDHLVVPTRVSHISLRHKNNNRGSGRKRTKNKRTIWAWVNSSARRQVCDTAFPVHLQTNADVHPSRNFLKATRNANSSWLVFPHCSWTLSHADWSLLLSGVDWPLPFRISLHQLFLWVLLSNSLWPCLAHFRSRRGLELRLCLVSRQNKQKDRLLGTQLLHIVTERQKNIADFYKARTEKQIIPVNSIHIFFSHFFPPRMPGLVKLWIVIDWTRALA